MTGECFKYSLAGGLLGLLHEIGIVYMAVICFVTDVSDKENRALPLPKEYKNFSTKELYELCLLNHVQILDRKRRDRKYLERCLRNADDRYNPYLRKTKQKTIQKQEGSKCLVFCAALFLRCAFLTLSITLYIRLCNHGFLC